MPHIQPKRTAIRGFRGEYHFLSNFFIEPDGTHVEGEYQAAKCLNIEDRYRFEGLSPTFAKFMGRKIALRPDWEHVKLQIMQDLLMQKFSDHAELRLRLLATDELYLEETNTWGDHEWGVCNGIGNNYLGHLLMAVRGVLDPRGL